MTDMDAILNDVFRHVMPRIKAHIRPRDEAEPSPPPAIAQKLDTLVYVREDRP